MLLRNLALTIVGSALLFSCRSASHATAEPAAAEARITVSSVPEVARLLQEKSAVILDANGADTRREYGTVPGAVLLSSYQDYAVSELPLQKSEKLVFYCGGTMCRASDSAAARAASAGYTNVSVMREGITGWKNAGHPTETPKS